MGPIDLVRALGGGRVPVLLLMGLQEISQLLQGSRTAWSKGRYYPFPL